MSTSLDLNLLRIFCAVVETQSMSEAAASLNMNQSVVSVAMQKLKQSLGCELFVRKSRGVSPTSTGMALYKEISVDLAQIDHAVTGVSAFDPLQSTRTFSVSCPEFVNTKMLKHLFYEDNRDLQIHLFDQALTSESLIAKILDRDHDLYIDVTIPECFELPFSSQPIDLYMLWHNAMTPDAGHQWLRQHVASIFE